MIKDLVDFRGGFVDSVPSELMADNELTVAENCQWRNGLVKRNGIAKYQTSNWTAYNGLKGIIRARINSTWYTIVALQENLATDVVKFFYGTGTTFAVIDDSYTWTAGYNVEMAVLDEHIVCVNGSNKPAVIYWTGSELAIQNLENHDFRIIDAINWWAGQWDNSEIGTGDEWIDDTADAQDTGADDFRIDLAVADGGAVDDGFYISSDFPFNKIICRGCQAGIRAAGAFDVDYFYWSGSAWIEITPTTYPTWKEAEGDKTIEFNLPLNTDGSLAWGLRTTVSTDPSGIANKYVFLIKFHTVADTTFYCDYIDVYNTQYLTIVLQNDRPHNVICHNNQIFFASGNAVNYSPPWAVTGWRVNQVEYFAEGGDKITGFCSLNNKLLVFKENTIYSFDTNNLLDPVRSRPLTTAGTLAPRSPAAVGPLCFFVSKDGIYIFDGSKAVKVSKHIKTTFDALTTVTNACGVSYKGEYWVSFPTHTTTLTADPDTFRVDEAGDGRVSWFKFTGYTLHEFEYCNGEADTGYLLGIIDQDTPKIMQCDSAAYDTLVATATPIAMTVTTKYYSWSTLGKMKYIGRIKPKLKQVSAATGTHHLFSILADDGTITASQSLYVTTGSGYWSTDVSAPYTVDGKNFAFKILHNGITSAGIIGFSIETKDRRY